MDIRRLGSEHREAILYIFSQAFEHGSRDLEEPEEWLTGNADRMVVFGGHDAAGLQASVVVVDYRLHFGPDVLVPMGAIEGVACLPASRGRGYAGTMLKHVLEQMRDAGQVTSLLEPFSWDYYRRFGWEWIGARRRYAVPARILKPDSETEQVRAATLQDRPKIMDAYTRFAARYRGMVVRTDKHWAKILDDSKKEFTYTYLYAPEGQVEGYLTYRGGKREETSLREFICLTPRAQRALLGLLRRHEMQINKFAWSAPPDDGLWSRDYHWDIETKIRPQLMGRIVDVPATLRAWKPSPTAQGQLVLGVQDECAPWNTGCWQIEFEGGQVEARPSHAEPQVSLDIQALTQAYFGTPAVPELRSWDRLHVHDEASYQAFTDLLAGPPMWINDGF